MKDKMTEGRAIPDPAMLHEPPHILPQLVEIVAGDWQPSSSEQEQLLEHLIECEYCQITLAWLVDTESGEGNANNPSDTLVQSLLARQRESIQMRHAHYEQIAAYIEMLEAQGAEEANKKYEELVTHLQHCAKCRHLVESARALFDEMAKDELAQETKVNTRPL